LIINFDNVGDAAMPSVRIISQNAVYFSFHK